MSGAGHSATLDARLVVERYVAAWRRGDLVACIGFCDPLIRVTQHYHDAALPFTGESVGTAAFAMRMAKMYSEWAMLDAEFGSFAVDGPIVHSTLRFVTRHVDSGETFDGTMRHVWQVADGRIVALDEYIDVSRLKAFLRLAGLPAVE